MFKKILLTLERMEERQKQIAELLEKGNYPSVSCADSSPDSSPDKGSLKNRWLESGIDNIMSYQVGRKKESEQG